MGSGHADVRGNVERASTKIAVEVAASEGVEPTELTPRLGDVVDPDAIDALFAGDGLDGTLEFAYCGYRIVVRGDDGVDVTTRRLSRQDDAGVDQGTTTDVD